MERSEYDKLDRIEDRMWWFGAAHANLMAAYDLTAGLGQADGPAGGADPGRVLDAGCGTGGLLAKLAVRYSDALVLGLDIDPGAGRRARAKSGRPVCAGSLNALPFANGAFAAIFSADVLCHRDVDQARALRQLHRVLGRDGRLVLNLPAYRWMLSRHDAAVYNVRRYTKKEIAALLGRAGFRPLFLSYWNMVLFPLMVVTRKLWTGRNRPVSDVRPFPGPVDALCRAATAIERALLRRGLPLPFGGSVIAVAVKAEGNVG